MQFVRLSTSPLNAFSLKCTAIVSLILIVNKSFNIPLSIKICYSSPSLTNPRPYISHQMLHLTFPEPFLLIKALVCQNEHNGPPCLYRRTTGMPISQSKALWSATYAIFESKIKRSYCRELWFDCLTSSAPVWRMCWSSCSAKSQKWKWNSS